MNRDELARWLVDNGAAEYLDRRYGHMSGEDLADLLLTHFVLLPIAEP